MARPVGVIEKKPRGRSSQRVLNERKVRELAARGVNTYDIAKHQGVTPGAVWQFLDRLKIERAQVEAYKESRADIFAALQGKALCVQEKLLDHLLSDGVLASLEGKAKVALVNSINNAFGTAFDKERLERGQSTQNHSLITKMMAPALKEAGKEAGKALSTPNESS